MILIHLKASLVSRSVKLIFSINGEDWGIDTVLREHVNRYYSHIPEELKSTCYPKISEFEWNGLKRESAQEKQAP